MGKEGDSELQLTNYARSLHKINKINKQEWKGPPRTPQSIIGISVGLKTLEFMVKVCISIISPTRIHSILVVLKEIS